MRNVTSYELRVTEANARRHCERSELVLSAAEVAIQKPLCNSVSSQCTSVKQKNSYTENHREPQRTTKKKNSVIRMYVASLRTE